MQRRPRFGGSVDVDTSFEQQPRQSKQKHSCKAAGNTQKQIQPSTGTDICNISLSHIPPTHPPTHTHTQANKYVSGSVRGPDVGILTALYPESGTGGRGGGPQLAV